MQVEITVGLIETMGDDLAIANAARVSYARESSWERFCSECGAPDPGLMHARDKSQPGVPGNICPGFTDRRLREADQGLIGYLMRERHGTPFEMVQFKFRVRVPIGVAREWQRHRIGSFNEVSTRYVEMQPDFYVPRPEDVRGQVGKPGHYQFVTLDQTTASDAIRVMSNAYLGAYNLYHQLLAIGVAKELARNVLPLGLFTEFVWSVNLRSLLNFLSLRTAPNALLEIRQAADRVEQYARNYVPVAMQAWDEHGRRAP